MRAPLGEFLDDEEALLDNLDRLAMAHKLLVLLDDSLAVDRSNEVVRAVEVIESIEGGYPMPVVEGDISTSRYSRK